MAGRSKRDARRQLLRTARRTIGDTIRGFRHRKKHRDGTLPTDADTRRQHLARMGTSVGARMGVARIKTIGRSKERKREIVQEAAMRSTADVLETMGNMKGAVMKIAQMASFAIDGLPQGVQQQLAQLQSAAPPMSYELVRGVVERELGAPPEKVFKSFDEVPMAAASIGQVHAATTKDGGDVVVKVQYPGVDEAIKADLANADMLFQTVAAMFGGFDPRELLQEVVERMTEEFDYKLEATNQRYFADRYHDHPYVKIPDIVDEHSATRVLTSERVHGRRFYDILDSDQATKDRFGEIINRFANGSIIVDGIFTADPHPGNYIFMDDGRICFLDFGLVKRLTPDEIKLVRAPGLAILHKDPDELERSLRDLNVIHEGVEIDQERLWQLFEVMLRPIVEDEPFRYTRKMVGDAFRDVAMPDSPYRDIQEQLHFPGMLVMWQRYTFGTSAVLGHLEAEANWHRIAAEHLLGHEPPTEIGRRWRSA
jgi:predicted unusual protein kinase regulating ubiquinone biosynthesis (AarF/ABC1/UbiB family)